MAVPKKTDFDVDADTSASAVAEVVEVPVVFFRDTVFTSRTLILPDDRPLLVMKGLVSVQADDAVALQYLKAHPDLHQE